MTHGIQNLCIKNLNKIIIIIIIFYFNPILNKRINSSLIMFKILFRIDQPQKNIIYSL
jgi:hypothetical protein